MEEQMKLYLESHLSAKDEWIIQLEETAKQDRVPIMDSIGIDYMLNLIKIHQPKRILEVGTAIGYSALRMLEANPAAEIITIEKDEERYQQATENIKKLHKEEQITVLSGDALDILDKLTAEKEVFDFIFIDAAKGKYQAFFESADQLLANGGLLITDNVLFRGYVANPELAPKRYKSMVKKIRSYNEFLTTHPAYITSILPIGDGVMISYKKD
ncbi:O-methyltransferase [Oceanobacillus sp. FSL H7-0719]|uniref:O-methyltransferase n=1 Tax=Oceanobacillus sp. FSL H7-0719 TaxID=2954507 RepID=UPI00324B420A